MHVASANYVLDAKSPILIASNANSSGICFDGTQGSSPAACPFSGGSLLAIIFRVLFVTPVEFVCSAAIPAIFAQVLALSTILGLEYCLCIGIYVFFFMPDNRLIFWLAVFAANAVI